jgi:hypothetical protein
VIQERKSLIEVAAIGYVGSLYRTTSYENAAKLWPAMPLAEREDYLRKMEAAFRAIEAQGVRLVPVEPTHEMWRAEHCRDGFHLEYHDLLVASPYAPEPNHDALIGALSDLLGPVQQRREGGRAMSDAEKVDFIVRLYAYAAFAALGVVALLMAIQLWTVWPKSNNDHQKDLGE